LAHDEKQCPAARFKQSALGCAQCGPAKNLAGSVALNRRLDSSFGLQSPPLRDTVTEAKRCILVEIAVNFFPDRGG